jgi:prepilin signal peptidase PulO-like enzyme (type II secretory pathway)
LILFTIFIIALIGACFGSFATLVSYRLALSAGYVTTIINDKNSRIGNIMSSEIIFSRSACPNCGNKLSFYNLIPIFSYLYQKGKCSFCSNKISIRYPIIEIVTAIIFVAIFIANSHKIDYQLPLILAIATILLIMSIIDIEYFFVPDSLQIILAIIIAILIYSQEILLLKSNHQLSIATIGYFTLNKLLSSFFYCFFILAIGKLVEYYCNQEAVGIDDIKFFAVAGLMIEINKILLFIAITGLIGLLLAKIWQKFYQENQFPFIPALALAMIISFFAKNIFIINF